jgi:putative DNA methylase
VVQAACLHVPAAPRKGEVVMPEHEIITRRYLPHWYVPGAAVFVTYRLYGTLPREVLDELRRQRESLLSQKPPAGITAAQQGARIHKQLFASYDARLDRGGEISHLADPRVAAVVRSNLYHHHGSKYHLLAYCVMSNHVHVLLVPREIPQIAPNQSTDLPAGEQPDETSPLGKIMHSLKSYTAHEANKILGRTGPFWQSESYDHWVRDDDELERIVDYIAANPVNAGLVRQPQDWFFCSCHDRFLTDGRALGWLC